MAVALLGLALVVAIAVGSVFATRSMRASREQYIRSYTFPPGVFDHVLKARPELAFKDVALVSHALRQFFLAYLRGGRQYVSMPSQVADDLWHAFILHTQSYEVFCRNAFGRFLHHTPAVALGKAGQGNAGLRRTWWWCCREENIDPRRPSRLPLLFALDTKLDVAGGFRYAADCRVPMQVRDRDRKETIHCGTSFGDSGYDGSTDGFGDSSSDGHHGSHHGDGGDASGSSDGGSSCGGGCGGGGGGD